VTIISLLLLFVPVAVVLEHLASGERRQRSRSRRWEAASPRTKAACFSCPNQPPSVPRAGSSPGRPVNEVLYCMARIGKPKSELSAASLADTKGYMLVSACHDQ